MKIFILSRGPLAEKVVNNLVEHGFAEMMVGVYEYSEKTHGTFDDIESVMPPDLLQCDLLLVLFLHPDVAPVIPMVAERTGAREVLAPIEDWHLMPEGLRRQLAGELDELGIGSEFPKPFCQLDGSKHPLIREFSEKLGRPRFEIEKSGGTISTVRTIRDTPCGSARFVATKLVGVDIPRSKEKAVRAHLDYPCLAGMDPDPILKKDIMQTAADCLAEEIARCLGEGAEPPAVEEGA